MTASIIFAVLTAGLLCSVSARPFTGSYKEDADKQLYIPGYYSKEQGQIHFT